MVVGQRLLIVKNVLPVVLAAWHAARVEDGGRLLAGLASEFVNLVADLTNFGDGELAHALRKELGAANLFELGGLVLEILRVIHL